MNKGEKEKGEQKEEQRKEEWKGSDRGFRKKERRVISPLRTKILSKG
jgi:hypothetical protein